MQCSRLGARFHCRTSMHRWLQICLTQQAPASCCHQHLPASQTKRTRDETWPDMVFLPLPLTLPYDRDAATAKEDSEKQGPCCFYSPPPASEAVICGVRSLPLSSQSVVPSSEAAMGICCCILCQNRCSTVVLRAAWNRAPSRFDHRIAS